MESNILMFPNQMIFHVISIYWRNTSNIILFAWGEELGYDRPSPKLLCFLKKHYGLCKYKAPLLGAGLDFILTKRLSLGDKQDTYLTVWISTGKQGTTMMLFVFKRNHNMDMCFSAPVHHDFVDFTCGFSDVFPLVSRKTTTSWSMRTSGLSHLTPTTSLSSSMIGKQQKKEHDYVGKKIVMMDYYGWLFGKLKWGGI